MYNDQLVYKVVIWAFYGISLWKEKVALSQFRYFVYYYVFINFVFNINFWVLSIFTSTRITSSSFYTDHNTALLYDIKCYTVNVFDEFSRVFLLKKNMHTLVSWCWLNVNLSGMCLTVDLHEVSRLMRR